MEKTKELTNTELEKDLPKIPSNPTTSENNPFKTRELNEEYTFAKFVTGRSNAQAAVASETVAKNPGVIYNTQGRHKHTGYRKVMYA